MGGGWEVNLDYYRSFSSAEAAVAAGVRPTDLVSALDTLAENAIAAAEHGDQSALELHAEITRIMGRFVTFT